MHEAMYAFVFSEFAHPHCPAVYFDVEQARVDWPDIMELMDFHGLTPLMSVRDSFSPELVKEFYATVYFSQEGPRTMHWMSAGTKCSATLAEFGALFDIAEVPFQPLSFLRIHVSKMMKHEDGIKHCYAESGSLHSPKVAFMSPFWHTIHAIFRNTINQKLGEKGEVRNYLVNLMFHVVSAKNRNRRLDILDYMWEEMKSVVLSKRVPVYAHFLQRLFAAKVPQVLLNNYPRVSPTLHRLPTADELRARMEDAPKPRSKRARRSSSEPQSAPASSAAAGPEKKKHGLKKILQKMNCFFCDFQEKGYQQYRKQKAYNKNQRLIMGQMNLPYPSSSDELPEHSWKSQNTYWFGDDASSLGPSWPGNAAGSSSAPAVEESASDDDAEFEEDGDEDADSE